jgi:hypothetical protein
LLVEQVRIITPRTTGSNGLRVVRPMTLMSSGLYNEPAGAYLPPILF